MSKSSCRDTPHCERCAELERQLETCRAVTTLCCKKRCVYPSGCETPNDCLEHGYCRSPKNAHRKDLIDECADLADQKLDHFSGTEYTYIGDVAEAIRNLKGKA